MYAYHLCEALGMDVDDGVVRVSLVHYNTLEQLIVFIPSILMFGHYISVVAAAVIVIPRSCSSRS